MACILVVDDDPILRELLAAWLMLSGHDAIMACDGLEALALARTQRPDLIICDYMMPRLDGPGFVAAIRADPAISQVPVIVLTVRSRPDDAGADDYVRKPIDWNELRARIGGQLRRKAA
jgi:DNA-binding response OmpR family regulator